MFLHYDVTIKPIFYIIFHFLFLFHSDFIHTIVGHKMSPTTPDHTCLSCVLFYDQLAPNQL